MMKNSKFRRILLLLACAVLLVSLSVGATLAYLTSTDEVENTFTVGDVQIKLDEAKVNTETGKAVEPEERIDDGNKLVCMVPGRLIDKDPTVTVLKDSENCYVRVKVTVDVSKSWPKPTDGSEDTFEAWAGKFAANYILTNNTEGFNTDNWNATTPSIADDSINTNDRTITYTLTYTNSETNNIVKKNTANNTKLEPVFTHIQVPDSLDKTDLDKLAGMSIKVVAEAIQAEGFKAEGTKTAEEMAWEAFEDN